MFQPKGLWRNAFNSAEMSGLLLFGAPVTDVIGALDDSCRSVQDVDFRHSYYLHAHHSHGGAVQ